MPNYEILTSKDIEFLKLLYKNKEGLTIKDISNSLNKRVRVIYFMVKKLRKKKFIEKIKIYNSILIKLKFNGIITLLQVKCPLCSEIFYIDSDAWFVTCRNKKCYFKSGKGSRFRFEVNKNTIIRSKTIILK